MPMSNPTPPVVGKEPPMPSARQELLRIVREEAARAIDAAAERAREPWLVAPGQALTYREKEQQARSYASAGYAGAVPPLVQLEVDASGGAVTAKQAADAIIAAADAARAALTAIELERRKGMLAVRKARTEKTIHAARDAAVQALGAL